MKETNNTKLREHPTDKSDSEFNEDVKEIPFGLANCSFTGDVQLVIQSFEDDFPISSIESRGTTNYLR